MDFLAMKNEERDALIQAINPVVAQRDAKKTELDAFAGTLKTESRSATTEEDELLTVALNELRSLNADIDERQAKIDVLDADIAELGKVKERRDNVPAQVRGSGRGAVSDAFDIELRTAPRTAEVRRDVATRAQRVLEDDRNGLTDEQRSHVDSMLRSSSINRDGALDRHLITTARPAYRSAFAKLMRDDKVFSPEEGAAIDEMRAINVTTDGSGGYLMPFTLDPSIILTNDGRTNPMRRLATVRSVVTDNWQGVSTAGVVASMDDEIEEVSDDTPSFVQPSINVKRARAFVEYSIDAENDFAGLASDVTNLIGDGFDDLEATQFATGDGAGNNVQGIIPGLTAGFSIVGTAGSGTYTLADLDSLSDAIPDRFDDRAVFLMHRSIITATRALAPADDPVKHLNSSGPMVIRSRDAYKYSALPDTVASGNAIVICGDIAAAYRINDRLGVTVERVPHLFGANGRPTAKRGWFAYKRFGAGVVNAPAARLLAVAA